MSAPCLWPDHPAKCGTLSAYNNGKCRGDRCAEAVRDYAASRRRAQGEPTARVSPLARMRAALATAIATWMPHAACRGAPDQTLWFPERGASTRVAKEICAACPVQEPCLDYALRASETHGIWGGKSERERRRLRRRRPAATGCAS